MVHILPVRPSDFAGAHLCSCATTLTLGRIICIVDAMSDATLAFTMATPEPKLFPFHQLYKALSFLFFLSTAQIVHSMRLVVQRVKSASVTVEDKVVSQIGPGLVALVGLHQDDDATDADFCARKLLACKLWENDSGAPWRQSVKQKGYDVLLVSQFTLYGRLTKKNQPDYQDSMKAIPAAALYTEFVEQVRAAHTAGQVCDGIFGAMMDVGTCYNRLSF